MSAVAFHPELPLILSASEDSSVRMWHATTYRVEQTFNYGMDRCWALAATKVRVIERDGWVPSTCKVNVRVRGWREHAMTCDGLNGFAKGCVTRNDLQSHSLTYPSTPLPSPRA